MIKPKLYINRPALDTSVSYKVLGPDDAVLSEQTNASCFSSITYHQIPATAQKILVHRPLAKIPYAPDVIERWIKEISALGFPCRAHLATDPKTMHFVLDLKDYAYKMHVSCTLQLIRCAFERFICYVPEFYFADPRADRFEALQEAHFELSKHDECSMFNSNHTVTAHDKYSKVKTLPVTKETLFARIAKTAIGVYADDYSDLSALWRGESPPVPTSVPQGVVCAA